jgi:hypothetical protein
MATNIKEITILGHRVVFDTYVLYKSWMLTEGSFVLVTRFMSEPVFSSARDLHDVASKTFAKTADNFAKLGFASLYVKYDATSGTIISSQLHDMDGSETYGRGGLTPSSTLPGELIVALYAIEDIIRTTPLFA